jgi:hypothetical protein
VVDLDRYGQRILELDERPSNAAEQIAGHFADLSLNNVQPDPVIHAQYISAYESAMVT